MIKWAMRIRHYIDYTTGKPHIYKHSINENEVSEVLQNSGEDRPGIDGSRVAIGKTENGRYLRIIYVPDPEPGSIFVITGYILNGKAITAYRRRMKKRGKK